MQLKQRTNILVLSGDFCGCITERSLVLQKKVDDNLCTVACPGEQSKNCGSHHRNFTTKVADHADLYYFGKGTGLFFRC